MADPPSPIGGPKSTLTVWHAAALAAGMVIGAGIFRSSASVAANVANARQFFLAWAGGGVFALAGSLCYAELAGAFPSPGGDWAFLRAAYGRTLAFLFAWSRFAVIFTGSTALLAFVFSDYLAAVVPLSGLARAGVAAAAIIGLTGLNLLGVRVGATVQIGLVILDALALLLLGAAGLLLQAHGAPPLNPAPFVSLAAASVPSALVFIMLAYGGWNDAATLSTELKGGSRAMVIALVGGMGLVTALYMIANWGYWRGLGLSGLAQSDAPAAALMLRAFGPAGRDAIVALVGATTLAVMNALIIVGGRTTYAACGDVPALTSLARWDEERGTPRLAMLAQSAVALVLVGWGAATRGGFETMVGYLSPVFWAFLTLSGLSVIVLRSAAPNVPRPFRVPLYPAVPILFTVTSAWVFWASVRYVGVTGVLISVGVLAAGLAVLMVLRSGGRHLGVAK